MAGRLTRPVLAAAALLLPGLVVAQGGGGGGGGFQGRPPKNLQVLPKDLTGREVDARMRVIAASLGVRCDYCHVTADGPDGREQTDHASDDKEMKKTARAMMRMVNDINDQYLIGTMGRQLTERQRVSCETCHHGLAKPRTIQAALADAIDAKGADSAITLYRALRTQYYGRAAYDFGELAIPLGIQQAGQRPEQRQAAIALLKLNLEFYPQSVPTFMGLAQLSAQAGDTAAAIDALTRAAAIAPDNPQVRNLLNRIRGARPSPGP